MSAYLHRRILVDSVLVGAVIVTAASAAIVHSNGAVLSLHYSEMLHGFAHHVSHWLVEVSGSEIVAVAFGRFLSVME